MAHEGSAIVAMQCRAPLPTLQAPLVPAHLSRSISAMAAAGARTLAPEIM
jgi:hypothetical protein